MMRMMVYFHSTIIAIIAGFGLVNCAPKPTDDLGASDEFTHQGPVDNIDSPSPNSWESHEVDAIDINIQYCLDIDNDGTLSEVEKEDLFNKIKRCEDSHPRQ